MKELLYDILKRRVFGRIVGFLKVSDTKSSSACITIPSTFLLFLLFQVIEFQKRGLPHAHMLFFLAPEDKLRTVDDYDRIICAELPDKDQEPDLWNVVTQCMIHGPCGLDKPDCPCMLNPKFPQACEKHYPKPFCLATRDTSDGYPEYRRRDDGRFCIKMVRNIRNACMQSMIFSLLANYTNLAQCCSLYIAGRKGERCQGNQDDKPICGPLQQVPLPQI